MLRIKFQFSAYICAIFLTACCWIGAALGQSAAYRKPWPTYSLQNMPQTRFTCHDKILGGYYADSETQCQMFHVCVKVAGIGVQDFRFLCPNGTAFDQEAQICADWGDVDCEQSVLYYGSDNFDLYRIGSGFESKRAPLAEEEEATFHLQRAESADIRRSKETRIDQKARPDVPRDYTKHFESSTRNSFNNYANFNGNQRQPAAQHQQQQQQQQQHSSFNGESLRTAATASSAARRPIVNYYTPTTSTAPSTTTTTTTTPRSTTSYTPYSPSTTTTTTERYNDESKQEFDDIFKGSHSSHFFANRNGGREDDFIDHPAAAPVKTPHARPNDFFDYQKATTKTAQRSSTTLAATAGSMAAASSPAPTRPRRLHPPSTHYTPTTTTATPITSTTAATPLAARHTTTTRSIAGSPTKVTKKVSYSVDSVGYSPFQKVATAPTATPHTTTRQAQSHNSNNNNNVAASRFQTQEHIQPTTYNPGQAFHRFKATTTPKYAQLQRKHNNNNNNNANDDNNNNNNNGSKSPPAKPTIASRKSQKFDSGEPAKKKIASSARDSTYVNHNEFNEFSKLKPQPFRAVEKSPPTTSRPSTKAVAASLSVDAPPAPAVEAQFFRGRGGSAIPARIGKSEPAPFTKVGAEATVVSHNAPRQSISRGSINYKATTQRSGGGETYASTTSTTTTKKFSTLVPRDSYAPTTFKPSVPYRKASFDAGPPPSAAAVNAFPVQTVRPAVQKPAKAVSSTPTTAAPTTVDPYYQPDEDDGQYHPELYEADFPKNRFNLQRSNGKSGASSSSATAKATITTTTRRPDAHSHNLLQQQSAFGHNFQGPQRHLKTQQQTALQKQQEQASSSSGGGVSSDDLSEEDELFKTAHSLNFGAASINKLRADIIKAEKTSQQYNSQYSPQLPPVSSPKTSAAPAAGSTPLPYSFPAQGGTSPAASTKASLAPFFATATTPSPFRPTPVATTTTTRRLAPVPTTTVRPAAPKKDTPKKTSKNGKGKKSSAGKNAGASKRPPHADEDTSYDYAYYDSDTLSESPQDYPEYEIAEFTKTKRN